MGFQLFFFLLILPPFRSVFRRIFVQMGHIRLSAEVLLGEVEISTIGHIYVILQMMLRGRISGHALGFLQLLLDQSIQDARVRVVGRLRLAADVSGRLLHHG